MGRFIDYIDKSKGVPIEKRAELKERMKILLQEGGMMDCQEQELLGKKL